MFTQQDDRFFESLVRISYEVEQLEGVRFADLPYDVLFNEKVSAVLRTPGVRSELAKYITRLNELLDDSEFFNRGTFTFFNLTNVTKSLGENEYFAATHSLLLHGEDEPRTGRAAVCTAPCCARSTPRASTAASPGLPSPNEASVRLHLRHGFEHVGTFDEAGFGLGRFWDVHWYRRTPPARVR